MSSSQTFKNNSRRVRGGNWRRLRKCVGKCRWCNCRNPRSPNCDQTCQDQQRVLKPTYIPFSVEKDSAHTDKHVGPAGSELRDERAGVQRRSVSIVTSALQQVSTKKKKKRLLNVSGFRKARVNSGIQREGNVCFRSVF